MWNKDTNWRQCSIISVDTLRNYNPGLVNSVTEDTAYLCAVSHDGDIVNDNMVQEPVVEFIGVRRVSGAAPEYTHGKHPSVLHLECYLEGEPVVLEFRASPKLSISKHNLIPAMQPDRSFFFDGKAKATIQNWLSYRYRRQRLPQAFIDRTLPLWDYLRNEGKKYVPHVMGYWVDYTPRGEELTGGIPYIFSLYIVYSSRHHAAQEQAEKLALELRNRFPEWQEEVKEAEIGAIELNECRAYAEDSFTLSDLQSCIQFSFDQLIFRQEPQEAVEAEA